jgi:hypothetical protein
MDTESVLGGGTAVPLGSLDPPRGLLMAATGTNHAPPQKSHSDFVIHSQQFYIIRAVSAHLGRAPTARRCPARGASSLMVALSGVGAQLPA